MSKPTHTRAALEDILTTRICRSHEDIQRELAKRSITITQASISRALTRIGAVKTHLPDGTIAYRLHKGTVTHRPNSPLSRNSVAHYMAERIIANGTVFVILGKPDSGRFLGTYVDDAALPSVAGTIAGGNTLLVIPFSHKNYAKTATDLQGLFPQTPFTSNT
ncbi:MAG: hypothetical protein EON60_06400 [Alphaproteobacteria bacterium]|nr:MAG: hypothetical protein EON60_06400 [Alphaproteobacteria bacterium]